MFKNCVFGTYRASATITSGRSMSSANPATSRIDNSLTALSRKRSVSQIHTPLNKIRAPAVLQTGDPRASYGSTHELEEPIVKSQKSRAQNNFTSGLGFLLWFSCLCDCEGDLPSHTPASGHSTLLAFSLPGVLLRRFLPRKVNIKGRCSGSLSVGAWWTLTGHSDKPTWNGLDGTGVPFSAICSAAHLVLQWALRFVYWPPEGKCHMP
jgi:hypothetical protein